MPVAGRDTRKKRCIRNVPAGAAAGVAPGVQVAARPVALAFSPIFAFRPRNRGPRKRFVFRADFALESAIAPCVLGTMHIWLVVCAPGDLRLRAPGSGHRAGALKRDACAGRRGGLALAPLPDASYSAWSYAHDGRDSGRSRIVPSPCRLRMGMNRPPRADIARGAQRGERMGSWPDSPQICD